MPLSNYEHATVEQYRTTCARVQRAGIPSSNAFKAHRRQSRVTFIPSTHDNPTLALDSYITAAAPRLRFTALLHKVSLTRHPPLPPPPPPLTMAAFTQPMPKGSVPKVVPVMMVVGSAAVLFTFINSQLNRQSNKFDRFFDQYNSTQSEASRRATFEGAVEDPRKSFYNVLGWKPSN